MQGLRLDSDALDVLSGDNRDDLDDQSISQQDQLMKEMIQQMSPSQRNITLQDEANAEANPNDLLYKTGSSESNPFGVMATADYNSSPKELQAIQARKHNSHMFAQNIPNQSRISYLKASNESKNLTQASRELQQMMHQAVPNPFERDSSGMPLFVHGEEEEEFDLEGQMAPDLKRTSTTSAVKVTAK